jgi:KaiC/GvpD/RAD55 family RecA-like ATPase
MGMDPNKVGEKLRVQDLSRIRRGVEELREAGRSGSPIEKPWLDVLKRHLEDVKAADDFSLLVLDSLPVLEIISGLRERRIGLFHFFGWLKALKVTSFVISETSADPSAVRDEDFLADGLLSLTMDRVGELDVYRRIRCVKMRGVNHNPGIFTLEFHDGAFHVTRVI